MKRKKGKQQWISLGLAVAMAVSSVPAWGSMGVTVSANGSDSQMVALAKKAADESIVLMENNGVLPLQNGTAVSFFANTNYYMSGDGSGQTSATDEDKITIQEGLEGSDAFDVKHVISNYKETGAELVAEYAADTKVAIMQISRSSGEGRNRSLSKGDWYLTDDETDMLQKLTDHFEKVVVVLNTTGVIDMAWVDEYQPDAVVCAGTPGQQGGNAVADVLSGAVNPSGKLVDTWASYESYSSTENDDAYILATETYTVDETTDRRYPYWGSAPNPSTGYDYGTYTRPIDEYMYTKYEEGIYVGYRYFETFADIVEGLEEQVYYPFGYGLSYTDFSVAVDRFTYDTTMPSLDKNDQQLSVEVTVENTGDMAGKEVVEVYYQAPDVQVGTDLLENPSLELAAYVKTDLLEPGEKQTVTVSFDMKDMASYAESIASYVLGAGEYSVYVGDSIADAKQRKAGTYTLTLGGSNLEYQEVEKLTNLAGLDMEGGVYDKYLEEYESQISLTELSKYDYENTKPDSSENISTSDVSLSSIPGAGKGNRYDEYNGSSDYSAEVLAEIEKVNGLDAAEYQFIDVYNGTVDMDTFLAQWEALELIAFIEGAGNTGQMFDSTAALRGGASSTQAIPRLGVGTYRLADGPGQVGGSRENGYSIAWPTATNLAMTWNEPLVEEIGEACGEEALEQDTDFWLAPSLNIHRQPLCGRNYEYFSEDPLLSGTMTAAMVRGAQTKGISVAIKHFAGNSTEQERWNNYDSVMSERTLREIYLKAFEITVKTSDPWGLMSAYGQVNGIHCSKNTELFEILKEEWGYTGALMIDWEGDFGNTVGTVLAGNNGLFPAQKGMTSYLWQAWTISEAGGVLTQTTAATKEEIGLSLTRDALEKAAKGMLEVMMRLKGFADNQGIIYENPYVKPEAQFAAAKTAVTGGTEQEALAVTLDKTEIVLEKGNDAFLTAVIMPEDVQNKNVIWSVNDPTVASVDENGKVTGLKKGQTTVTVTTENGLSAACAVTVKDTVRDAQEAQQKAEEAQQKAQEAERKAEQMQESGKAALDTAQKELEKAQTEAETKVKEAQEAANQAKAAKDEMEELVKTTEFSLKKAGLKTIKSTKKKQVKVFWKKFAGADGYEIQLSLRANFKTKKTVTVENAEKLAKLVKGLQSKKTYYVRVRAYINTEQGKVYTKFSNKKKVIVK